MTIRLIRSHKDNQISFFVKPELKRKVLIYLFEHNLSMTSVLIKCLENIARKVK